MFYLIGTLTLGYVLFNVIKKLVLVARIKFFPAKIDLEKYGGEWCLLTGCTDGIGRQYALQLARNGARKFVLIGRSQQKLTETIQEIKKISSHSFFEFDTLVVDFAKVSDYGFLDNLLEKGSHIILFCYSVPTIYVFFGAREQFSPPNHSRQSATN